MCDAVILAGDLNYRLQAPPHEVVRMVSKSVKARQQETARHDCQVGQGGRRIRSMDGSCTSSTGCRKPDALQ